MEPNSDFFFISPEIIYIFCWNEKLWNYCVIRGTHSERHALVVPFILFSRLSLAFLSLPAFRKYNLNSSASFSRLMMFVVIKRSNLGD
jgi:hypothetical protein